MIMTQDKARKAATRQRMAETGEPYSVARHAVENEAAGAAADMAAEAADLTGGWADADEQARAHGVAAQARVAAGEAQRRFDRAQEEADRAQEAAERATPVPESYDMAAAFMLLQVHERGNHAVMTGAPGRRRQSR
jgi:hypothetical protein